MTLPATLTDNQNKFLDLYFGEAAGHCPTIMDITGWSKSYVYGLRKRLKKEIIERTEEELVGLTPQAVKSYKQGLTYDPNNKEHDGIGVRMEAAKQVFDRVGVVKKNQVEVKGEVFHSVQFFLPEKEEVVIDATAEEQTS